MQKFIDIPTIDISSLIFSDDLNAKNIIAEKISYACRGPGFFYVSNHGIDINKLQNVVYNLFKTITDTEKFNIATKAYNKSNSNEHVGYYMPIADKKPAERFLYANPNFTNTHDFVVSKNREINVWPDDKKHLGFKDFCEHHYWCMFNLASKLLQVFAISLGKEQSFFNKYLSTENTLSTISFIRRPFMEKYPVLQKADDGTKICFGEHKDVSLISIAFQTPIPNVQVKIDNEYFDIPVSDENLLVHCGSYMSYVTYDYFPAFDHRVKFINAERLCLPFFLDLDYHAAIEPFSPSGEVDKSCLRPPIEYGEYLKRAREALLVKNGQI